MPRLLDYFSPAYAFLSSIDPSLPRALFVAAIFGVVLAWRKYFPDSWRAYSNVIPVSEDQTSRFVVALQKAWQVLPSLVLSAIAGALGTGGNVWPTLKVALLGLLPPLIHELGWRYKGELGDGKPVAPPPSGGREIPDGPLTETAPTSLRPPSGFDAEFRSLRWRNVLGHLVLACAALVALGVTVACARDVRPCSTEDFATGPLALHNASCAAERQAKFPNTPDDLCDAKPGCKAIVDRCDRWVEERCQ